MADPHARFVAETLLADMTWLRALARRLVRDPHEAEDVVQDTWLARLRDDAGELHGPRLRAWLTVVARNLVLKRHRDDRVRRRHEEEAAEERARASGDEVERLREQRRIAGLVLELREPYRTALVLRYQEGLSYASIARRQGVTQAAARQRVSRGVAKLRERLDAEVGGERSAWVLALGRLYPLEGARATFPLMQGVLMGMKAIVVWTTVTLGAVWWVTQREQMPKALTASEGEAPADAAPEEIVALPGGREEQAPGEEEPLVAARSTALLVTVLSEEGRAIEGARVLLLPEGQKGVLEKTDAQGKVRFERAVGPAYLVAHASRYLPASTALEEARGEHELVLRRGERVAGHVLVDGAAPREALKLFLVSNDTPRLDLPVELAEAASSLLGLKQYADVVTAGDGSFAFEGLPSDWSGRLELPSTHWLAAVPAGTGVRGGHEDRLLLSKPIEGLVLQAVRLPVVQGRVIWGDTEEAVAHADVVVEPELAGGFSAPYFQCRTRDDGRFLFGVGAASEDEQAEWLRSRRALERVVITVTRSDCLPVRLEYGASDLGPDGELGDIRLERGRALHFRVRDPEGNPMAGAVALGRSLSEPTGPDGVGMLGGIPPEAGSILVGALGRHVLSVPIGASGAGQEEPLEVVLPWGNRLELSVLDGEGRVATDLWVRVASDSPLYEGAEEWAASGESPHGGAYYARASYWEKEHGVRTSTRGSKGMVQLSGFRDDLSLHVEVSDAFHQRLLEESFRGPSNGELLARTIQLSTSSECLKGSVENAAGEPLANASVCLQIGRHCQGQTTGSTGSFEFQGIHPGKELRTLTASLPGYSTCQVEDVPLSNETAPRVLVLERGRTIRVELVDAAGTPIDGSVTARAEGFETVQGVRLEPGVARLQDVPAALGHIELSYGWRRYELDLAPEATEAHFVVPVHGTLALFAPFDAPVFEVGLLGACITSVDDSELDRFAAFEKEGDRALQGAPFPLLPGRYRVRLEQRWWTEDRERHSEPLPGEWGLTVRAGEETRLRLGD